MNADYHANNLPAGHYRNPLCERRGDAREVLVVSGTAGPQDLRFQPSTVAGARIAAGSTAGVTMDGGDIAYRADATVADLNLRRLGEQFGVDALATERYASAINGHITATGRGSTPETLDVTADGALNDSSILGGTIPQLVFNAAVARDTAHVKAAGSFAGFDPAVATGRPDTKGNVAGTIDVDATVSGLSSGVTPDSVQADGKLTLQPSTIGGLEITSASLDGAYHDAGGDIRTLEVTGRDLNVQASGTLALNETGQSNLKVHADSPSLEEIGKLVDQPLTGIGKIDATITGNRRELKATGTLIGDGVKYGENGALTVSSSYTAVVPELAIEDANVVADTHATFVSTRGSYPFDTRATSGPSSASHGPRSAPGSRTGGSASPARSCCTRTIRKSIYSGSA